MTDRADRGQTGWICGYRQRVAGIFIDCRVAVGEIARTPELTVNEKRDVTVRGVAEI